MNIYLIDMLVVPVVQFAAKSTQKTAMYFASEMDRKWRPSNKNRNVIGQTLFIHGSATSDIYRIFVVESWLRHRSIADWKHSSLRRSASDKSYDDLYTACVKTTAHRK